ncbi:MAG TPA: porin family protein [Rhodobacteraceae bacterium]|nr:porin family protein [Paracoccaceae bacterium]
MHYRTVLLVAAIATGFAVKAQAQDRWSGLYGGISVNNNRTTANVGANAAHRYKTSKNISISGLYAGYNFAGNGGFVWGGELGITALDNKGTRTDAALGTSQFTGSYLFSPHLRAGWASDKFFFYGTAGVGISDAGVKPAGVSGKTRHTGFSYGLGVEMAINNGWSARLEATQYNFGKADAQSFNGSSQKVDTDIRMISLGLSRKF